MSYRLSQLSPQASTRVRVIVRGPWSDLSDGFHNVQVLRSWLEYDSAVEKSGTPRGINWYAVIGLLLVLGASAGLWAGVAWLVTHFWK